jgi:hypothetical protein
LSKFYFSIRIFSINITTSANHRHIPQNITQEQPFSSIEKKDISLCDGIDPTPSVKKKKKGLKKRRIHKRLPCMPKSRTACPSRSSPSLHTKTIKKIEEESKKLGCFPPPINTMPVSSKQVIKGPSQNKLKQHQ